VPNNLQLRTYTTLDELSTLRGDWDELLAEYPQASTFSTWEWLTCWWQSFGSDRRLMVLALFDSSRLIGLAPLSISRERFAGCFSLRVVRLMGDGSGDSDNLDLPVRPDFAKQVAQCLTEYLGENKDQWDVCLFNSLSDSSPCAKAVAELLNSIGWTAFNHSTPSSAIHLAHTWEEYRKRLSSEDQKNLPRYLRRLRKHYSTRISRCTDPNQLPAYLEALFRLHQARWQSAGKPGSFASVARQDFYARLSRHLLDRRALELWVLELNDEIAAVQFAFRYKDRVFQLQEGYDHRRASDRVGYVLRGEVLKQLVSEGVRVYDFLGGEDDYKSRWGAEAGYYQELHFARSFSLGGVLLWSVELAQESKRWLRGKLPDSAWRVLRNVRRSIQLSRDRGTKVTRAKNAPDRNSREASSDFRRFSCGPDGGGQASAQGADVT
jgi:CelD/BcsL family acetyltransferase involved in cellulose biosynthesis